MYMETFLGKANIGATKTLSFWQNRKTYSSFITTDANFVLPSQCESLFYMLTQNVSLQVEHKTLLLSVDRKSVV